MVRFNWTEQQLLRIEPWLQGSVWTFALAAAIFPIPLGLYNNVWQICWFNAYPYGCQESYQYGEENSTCTRGDNAGLYAMVFTAFPAWACIIAGIVIMVLMYLSVRSVEQRVSRYAGSVDSGSALRNSMSIEDRRCHQVNRQRSRAVAVQAMLYVLAFLLTYSLDAVNSILFYASETYVQALDLFAYILFPLQGFFNFIIFCRTRRDMKTPEGRFLRRLLCCCCSRYDRSPAERRRSSIMQTSTLSERQFDSTRTFGSNLEDSLPTSLDKDVEGQSSSAETSSALGSDKEQGEDAVEATRVEEENL